MSVIERVVKSAGEPGKTDLWLKEKETGLQLCAYHNGQWVPISGGSGGTSVSWGTESDYTVPLTVGGESKTICLDGYSAGGGGDCPCKEVYFDAEMINDGGNLYLPYPSGAEGIQMAKNVLSEISEGTDWHNIGVHFSGEVNGAEIEEYVKFFSLSTLKSGDDIVCKRYGAFDGEMQYELPISYNSEQLDLLMDLNEQMDEDGLGRVIFVDPNVGVSLNVDKNGYLKCYLCNEDTALQSNGYAYIVDESGHCYEASTEYVMENFGINRITNIGTTQYTMLDYKILTLPYSDVAKFIGTYILLEGIG